MQVERKVLQTDVAIFGVEVGGVSSVTAVWILAIARLVLMVVASSRPRCVYNDPTLAVKEPWLKL